MHGPRKERARARARLQLEAPISDDVDISKLEKQAADYLFEAERRASPHTGITDVLGAVARDYFAHVLRKERRRSRQTSYGRG